MNVRSLVILSTILATTLTACGGGGGTGPITPSTGGANNASSVQTQTEDSIGTANSVGQPVQDFSSYNDTMTSPLQSSDRRTGASVSVQTAGDGSCNNGVEFFAPDKKGDPNSTERIDFYDNACTAMARDAVRIYTSTSSTSETVSRNVSLYALNSSTPSATRSETVNFLNATFDQFGYPIAKDGFSRSHTGELDINGAKTIDGDGEFVVAPSTGSSATFCGDSAGFNATGDQSLNETFGWAGTLPSGTRTVNNDGSVTWSSTHSGSVYTGPIGGLTIQAGAQNTACPISTPMFTLAGGTVKGTYNIPVSATFNHGVLSNLTIQNAVLVNGDTLNVQTNAGVPPSDPHFISGTLTNNSGVQVSTFNTDAFGDGVLIVAATGKQYQIEDWHVVKT